MWQADGGMGRESAPRPASASEAGRASGERRADGGGDSPYTGTTVRQYSRYWSMSKDAPCVSRRICMMRSSTK